MLQHSRPRGARVRAPLGRGCGSAAVAEGRGYWADGGLLLDVLHPVVVTNVSLRRAGQAKNRGGETTGDDCGKSELVNCSSSLFLFLVVRAGGANVAMVTLGARSADVDAR